MRNLTFGLLAVAALLSSCGDRSASENEAASNAAATVPAAAAKISLARLDCGSATIKNFDKFFSDKPGLYESAPRDITDSCVRSGVDIGKQRTLADGVVTVSVRVGKERTSADGVVE